MVMLLFNEFVILVMFVLVLLFYRVESKLY